MARFQAGMARLAQLQVMQQQGGALPEPSFYSPLAAYTAQQQHHGGAAAGINGGGGGVRAGDMHAPLQQAPLFGGQAAMQEGGGYSVLAHAERDVPLEELPADVQALILAQTVRTGNGENSCGSGAMSHASTSKGVGPPLPPPPGSEAARQLYAQRYREYTEAMARVEAAQAAGLPAPLLPDPARMWAAYHAAYPDTPAAAAATTPSTNVPSAYQSARAHGGAPTGAPAAAAYGAAAAAVGHSHLLPAYAQEQVPPSDWKPDDFKDDFCDLYRR
jgi:hypothetical protein